MKKLVILLFLICFLFGCSSNKNIFNKRKYTPGVFRNNTSNYKSNVKKPSEIKYAINNEKELENKEENQQKKDSVSENSKNVIATENESKSTSGLKKIRKLKSAVSVKSVFEFIELKVDKNLYTNKLSSKIVQKEDSENKYMLLFIGLGLIIVGILLIMLVAIDILPSTLGLAILLALLGFLSFIAGIIVLIIFLVRLF